jgi:hypothetical protein
MITPSFWTLNSPVLLDRFEPDCEDVDPADGPDNNVAYRPVLVHLTLVRETGRKILTLGEGFNTQVITLWCFNIVGRKILDPWGRAFQHSGNYPMNYPYPMPLVVFHVWDRQVVP